jgi:NAD(P)-dependent dehydrogenase (short-subunit alcohol dehydrogenase family)
MVKLNIVVTGANRGIGLSFCKHFANLGHNIYAACRKQSAELKKFSNNVIENIDISDAKSCDKLFEKLSDVKIDLLINNAGILSNEILGQIDYESINKQFQVNALGALRVSEGLLNNFQENSKIAIITSRMASIGDNGSGGRYGYRMSKAALNAAGKSLAVDLKPRGISVGIFHPGLVSTDMIGGNGDISPDVAASRISGLIEKLSTANSGEFWHSNGETLPW